MIEIASSRLRATIDHENGACIRSFDFLGDDGAWRPVLAPIDAAGTDAGSSAMFAMFPFANRAPENELRFGDQRITRRPNTSDPLALHGYAWQSPWEIDMVTESACRTGLAAGCDPDFPVTLVQTFRLDARRLAVSLTARNEGDAALPVGFGWHPYFPHTSETQLRFEARLFWLEGPGHLPTEPLSVPPELSFTKSRRLPSTWRNNCYQDWTGSATILQPDLGYKVDMMAGPHLRHLMLYIPQTGVFAVEPQSHISGRTAVREAGLKCFGPGAQIETSITFNIAEIAAPNERQPKGTPL